jgi:hypothetical protein
MNEMLKGKIGALTTDGWTSRGKHTYYGFTFHYIDEQLMELKSLVLGIREHAGESSTADIHVEALQTELTKHGLSWSQIVSITTDTEPTMNKTGRLIIAHAKNNHNVEINHIGCIDHILQVTTKLAQLDPPLAAGENHGLEAETLLKARALVGTFNSSTQLMNYLKRLQASFNEVEGSNKILGLIQDIVTRWWSTFTMCERLLRLKTHIDAMANMNPPKISNNLLPEQWDLLKDVVKILGPFRYAQQLFEGEKYVTISLVPTVIFNIRKGLQFAAEQVETNSKYVQSLLDSLLKSLNKEWGSGDEDTMYDEHKTLQVGNRHKGFRVEHMVGAFLDPRYKNLKPFGVQDKRKIRDEVHKRVKKIALMVVDEPEIVEVVDAGEERPRQRRRVGEKKLDHMKNVGIILYESSESDDDENEEKMDMNDDDIVNDRTAQLDAAIAAEIDAYTKEKKLKRVDDDDKLTNPLAWWKERRNKYPLLIKLVIRTLCIPATSAPSERLFSQAGLTIAKDRARLLPENAEEIIFLKEIWPVIEENRENRKRKRNENLE